MAGLTGTVVTCNTRYMAAEPTPRREELLEKSIAYLLKHGVGDLSLRPLAAAIGTKARLLIYHFGSRDALVSAALSLTLRRIQQTFLTMSGEARLERALVGFWRFATDKATAPHLRLLFEVHGLAIHNPAMFGAYVRGSLESWKALVTETLRGRTMTKRQREELATVIIATFDGLLLDYLATGDLDRNTRALVRLTRRLDAITGGGP
jgi:AcrR family transcriptional regulator